MSKVIKSGHLKFESPRLINHFPAAEAAASIAPEELLQPDDVPVDVEQVKEQAEEIIKETEQMVKELLGTARQEAEKIIKSAKAEAEAVIQEGQGKAKEAKDQGFNEGWQVGYTESVKKAEEEMKGSLLAAERTLAEAKEERTKIICEAENEIVQLAVMVAQKVINHEVTTHSELIVGIVKKALEKVRDREEILIRVSPDDIDMVIDNQEEVVSGTKGIKKMKMLADNGITAGGCVIETSNGTVDARVERQLSEIEHSLLEVNSNG